MHNTARASAEQWVWSRNTDRKAPGAKKIQEMVQKLCLQSRKLPSSLLISLTGSTHHRMATIQHDTSPKLSSLQKQKERKKGECLLMLAAPGGCHCCSQQLGSKKKCHPVQHLPLKKVQEVVSEQAVHREVLQGNASMAIHWHQAQAAPCFQEQDCLGTEINHVKQSSSSLKCNLSSVCALNQNPASFLAMHTKEAKLGRNEKDPFSCLPFQLICQVCSGFTSKYFYILLNRGLSYRNITQI